MTLGNAPQLCRLPTLAAWQSMAEPVPVPLAFRDKSQSNPPQGSAETLPSFCDIWASVGVLL